MDFYLYDLVSPLDGTYLLVLSALRSSTGCAVLKSDDINNGFSKTAYLAMNINEAITNRDESGALIRNLTEWLREKDYAKGGVSGIVSLEDSDNFYGVDVYGSIDSTISQSDGRFFIKSLLGVNDIVFSKHRWETITETTDVNPSEISLVNVRLGWLSIDELAPSQYTCYVYPNPVNGLVTIETGKDEGNKELSLFDINGRLLLTKSIQAVELKKAL
jgi:hypothetical protein